MRFFPMIARKWRYPNIMYGLMAFELLVDIAILTLFGIADPDTYRTKLWQNGYDEGFNSSPNRKVYELANYRPYETPLVWSQFITRFNVVVSVLATFFLLIKVTMFVMRGFRPLLSLILHIVLLALCAVSIHGQAAEDMSDPEFSSPGLPWYMSKGCSHATDKNYGYCMQARGAFASTCIAIALFSVYVIFSLYSCIPTPQERASRQSDIEMSKISQYSPDPSSDGGYYGDKNHHTTNQSNEEAEETREERWERNRQLFLSLPKSPVTPAGFSRNPMTPRTVAFSHLNGQEAAHERYVRQVPLPSTAGPSKDLPFRAYEKEIGTPDGR
ncbi:hypothetical protein MBLNU230_g0685t1 [Neophaeotheca triangularis]